MPAKTQIPFEEDPAPCRLDNILIAEICLDELVRSRACPNQIVVDEYAERMREGDTFPPIRVIQTDGGLLLVDGFYRVEAAKQADKKMLRAEISKGTLRDALLLSARVNAQNGRHRTNEDKRRAVEKLLTDDEWSKWSDGEIARRCVVSQAFVSQRRSMIPTHNVLSEKRRTYTTKHGGEAVMNIAAIGKRPETLPSKPIRPEPPVEAEVVSLSDTVENQRAQFIAALNEMEKALRSASWHSLFGYVGADQALRGRMKAAGDKLQHLASWTPPK